MNFLKDLFGIKTILVNNIEQPAASTLGFEGLNGDFDADSGTVTVSVPSQVVYGTFVIPTLSGPTMVEITANVVDLENTDALGVIPIGATGLPANMALVGARITNTATGQVKLKAMALNTATGFTATVGLLKVK